jgi:hypothetical protein
MIPTSKPAAPRSAGRWLFLLGLAVAWLGVFAYVGQVLLAQRLFTPWYLPIAGTLGVLLLLVALWRRVTVWRVILLLPMLLLAAGEWFMVRGSLPAYTGPVEVGRPFPAFATTLADGTPLTVADLHGDEDTVMVFFRGRW